jgi:hypothetical protein
MVNASQIKEHMAVKASDGQIIGKVDHMEGPDGKHHFIPLDWVESVDSQVHLGKAAKDVKAQWN